MKLLTASIIGSLAVSEAATLKKPTPAVMKLRGGLGGLDSKQVATYASYLFATNAGVMALAPEKAMEMYGVENPSAITSQFAEWAGGTMLMIAIASILGLGGMDFTTALAWGSVPTLVQNAQGLLKGTATKLGFGTMAQYMPAIVSAVLTAGLFGKGLDAALALKVTAAWMGLNGLGCYFFTEPFMKAWEGPAMGVVETTRAKFFGGVMTCAGLFAASVAFGEKDLLTAIAYSWAGFLATQVDALFVSKTMEKLGADVNAGYAWLAIQAFVVAAILA